MVKKWMALALIGVGIFLVLIGLGYTFYIQKENSSSSLLPKEMVGFPLGSEVTGSSAFAELSWMHGQEFQLKQAAVGTYGNANQVIIYVAGMDTISLADRLITAMRDKIAAVDSPFEPIAEREIDQRMVYELDGMGQRHFYFKSDQLIIWLAVDEGFAEDALRQVLRFYP
ncbi:MAG: hypothetical protein ABUK20_04620 [Anaerolineales bacterium]